MYEGGLLRGRRDPLAVLTVAIGIVDYVPSRRTKHGCAAKATRCATENLCFDSRYV